MRGREQRLDPSPAGCSRLCCCWRAFAARADDCVADLGGVLDGFVRHPSPPSQIKIDGNCTIRNFPASNPLTTNFSFFTQPGQTDQRWLVIFDNVLHTGKMACDAVAGHKIWFTNGSLEHDPGRTARTS